MSEVDRIKGDIYGVLGLGHCQIFSRQSMSSY